MCGKPFIWIICWICSEEEIRLEYADSKMVLSRGALQLLVSCFVQLLILKSDDPGQDKGRDKGDHYGENSTDKPVTEKDRQGDEAGRGVGGGTDTGDSGECTADPGGDHTGKERTL